MPYEFDWIDAFTDKPFAGNGCVVVHDAAALSLDDRMALVRETSLSECAYLVPSEQADFGARYYLAEREIFMAGHPTIATVLSLLHRGLVDASKPTDFTLEVGAGVLPISVHPSETGSIITMTQARPVLGNRHDASAIAAIYGLQASDVVGTPRTVSTGSPFCIAVLKDKDALRRARLNADALADYLASEIGDFQEPFLVTLGGATDAGDTFSRLLLPAPMPPEDPFTGSATGCMAAYLWAEGLINRPDFVAEQGHWLGRPGKADVEVLGPRGNISGVSISGQGYVVMSGTLSI